MYRCPLLHAVVQAVYAFCGIAFARPEAACYIRTVDHDNTRMKSAWGHDYFLSRDVDQLGRAVGLPEVFMSSGEGGGVIQGSASEGILQP